MSEGTAPVPIGDGIGIAMVTGRGARPSAATGDPVGWSNRGPPPVVGLDAGST
jgi:hypothetical protein